MTRKLFIFFAKEYDLSLEGARAGCAPPPLSESATAIPQIARTCEA